MVLWPFTFGVFCDPSSPCRLSPGGGSAPAPAAASAEGTFYERKHEQGFAGECGPSEEMAGVYHLGFLYIKEAVDHLQSSPSEFCSVSPPRLGCQARGLSGCVLQRKGYLWAWETYLLLRRC